MVSHGRRFGWGRTRAPHRGLWSTERLVPLDALIREQPRRFLGDPSRADTTLPYLFKVLAAAQPLSIQCHPDDGQAAAGFAREQAAGIPRHAPHRLYPDPRAKPELVVARTPFVGLKGFRSVDDLQRRLRDYGLEALAPAAGVDEPAALQSTFSLLMRANPDQQKRWATQATEVAAHRHEPEAEVIRQLRALYPNDPGVLAPLFLNLVTLAPGQALFLEARELHAYLQGTALEIMANSDNVLRGGLTQKHMDVDELMSVLDFTPRPPAPLTPVAETVGGGWQVYPTTTPQFGLRVGTVRPSGALARPKPTCLEIVLCTDGEVALSAPGRVRRRLGPQAGTERGHTVRRSVRAARRSRSVPGHRRACGLPHDPVTRPLGVDRPRGRTGLGGEDRHGHRNLRRAIRGS